MKRRVNPRRQIMAMNQDDLAAAIGIERVKTPFALTRHGIITGPKEKYTVLVLKTHKSKTLE